MNASAVNRLRKQTKRTNIFVLLFRSVAVSTILWIWFSNWKLDHPHQEEIPPSSSTGAANSIIPYDYERNATESKSQETAFHIVFSTGCNAFQGTTDRTKMPGSR
jgi:hypothetical protein